EERVPVSRPQFFFLQLLVTPPHTYHVPARAPKHVDQVGEGFQKTPELQRAVSRWRKVRKEGGAIKWPRQFQVFVHQPPAQLLLDEIGQRRGENDVTPVSLRQLMRSFR